ncbi:MAG: hypothetical protein EAZ84_07625 [Verrucomicrobia bacterium]|nr:MAG: hypothetical protein EAZ84_07625 [Verrucomicrobiota bacterium]
MNHLLFPLGRILPVCLLVGSGFSQELGFPVLSTPGTATWATEATATGNRTVFTITGNTVLDWESFDLATGSELVFDFLGGESVANILGGSGVNFISGTVSSNGAVGFFSPSADLVVDGSITAKSVTLAAMDVDAAAFVAGDSYTMSVDPGGWNGLAVSGQVVADAGDVVLASRFTDVSGSAKIDASGTLKMAGSTDVAIHPGAADRGMEERSGSGFVLHLADSRASRIEVAAGREIAHRGSFDAGSPENRIFLEVGSDGKILREGNGLTVGRVVMNGEYEDGGLGLDPNEGDAAAAVGSSTLKIPALKRPDGSAVSTERTVVHEVPMSATAESGRDAILPEARLVARDKPEKPMFLRASFFGMRGGSQVGKR